MRASFQTALSSGNMQAVRTWPKGDLHNHGALSGDRLFLRERTGRDVTPVGRPLRSMDEMHQRVGSNVMPLFAGQSGRLLGYEAALALAKRDGVSRIEFGDDVWQITQGHGPAEALFASIQNLHRTVAPNVEWIPKVTISTDDALVFGATVSEEFVALAQAGLFTPDELDEIRLNSLTDECMGRMSCGEQPNLG